MSHPRRPQSWSSIVVVALLSASSVAFAKDDKDAVKPTTLSLRAKNRKVSDVLEYIEKKTANRVTALDDFGRPDNAILARKVSLTAKKTPFWEVIADIAEQTETDFVKLDDGVLHLGKLTDFNRIGREPAIGASVTVGALRITPCFKKFFHHLVVTIQPEPRLGRFEPGDVTLTVVPKKGKPLELERHSFSGPNGITGFLDLQFEFKQKRDKIPLDSIKSLKLAGYVSRVRYEKKRLGSISKLLAAKKPMTVGLAKVRLKETEKETEDGEQLLVLRLEVEGPFVTWQNFQLIGPQGEPLDARGGSSSVNEGVRRVTRQYSVEDLGKKPVALPLVFRAPVAATKVPIDVEFSKLHAPKK